MRPVLNPDETAAHRSNGLASAETTSGTSSSRTSISTTSAASPTSPGPDPRHRGRVAQAMRSPSRREKIRYRSAQWAHGPEIVEHSPQGNHGMGSPSPSRSMTSPPGSCSSRFPATPADTPASPSTPNDQSIPARCPLPPAFVLAILADVVEARVDSQGRTWATPPPAPGHAGSWFARLILGQPWNEPRTGRIGLAPRSRHEGVLVLRLGRPGEEPRFVLIGNRKVRRGAPSTRPTPHTRVPSYIGRSARSGDRGQKVPDGGKRQRRRRGRRHQEQCVSRAK